jgi:hypothetical protein
VSWNLLIGSIAWSTTANAVFLSPRTSTVIFLLPRRILLINRSFIPPLTQSIQAHLLTLTTRHRSISHILAEYKLLSERFDMLDEDAIQLLHSLGVDVDGVGDVKKNQNRETDGGTTSSSTMNAIQDLDILTSTIESTTQSLDELMKTLEEKSEAMDEVEETMGNVVPVIVRLTMSGTSFAR